MLFILTLYDFANKFRAAVTSRRGKKLELREVLQQGAEEDLLHLMNSLRQCMDGGRGPAFAFIVEVPKHYSEGEAARLKIYLQSLGFAETFIGESYVLRLPGAKVDELHRAVLNLRGNVQSSNNQSNAAAPFSPSASISASFQQPDTGRDTIADVKSIQQTFSTAPTPTLASEGRRTRSASANEIVVPSSSEGIPLSRARSFTQGVQGARKQLTLSVITESAKDVTEDGGAAEEVEVQIPSSTSARLRRQATRFPPRARVFSTDTDRSDSPFAQSPRALSPRFFGDLDTGRSTPASSSPGFRDDEVYPQLGAGLQDLALGQEGNSGIPGAPAGVGYNGAEAMPFRLSRDSTRGGMGPDSHDSDDTTILEEGVDDPMFDPDPEMDAVETSFDNAIKIPALHTRNSSEEASMQSTHAIHDLEWHPEHYSPPAFTSVLDQTAVDVLRPGIVSSRPWPRASSGAFDTEALREEYGERDSGGHADPKVSYGNPRLSTGSVESGGGHPTSPIFQSVWNSLRRESDGSDTNAGNFPRDSLGNAHGARGSSFERKPIRRSVTMPTMRASSRPALHPGQQTPCGPTISSTQTPGKFNTPQSRVESIVLSGRGESDWGVSTAASDASVQLIMQRLVLRHGKDIVKPGLFRSHSADDLDLLSSHFSPSMASSSSALGLPSDMKYAKPLLRRSDSLDERHRDSSESLASLLGPSVTAQAPLLFSLPHMASERDSSRSNANAAVASSLSAWMSRPALPQDALSPSRDGDADPITGRMLSESAKNAKFMSDMKRTSTAVSNPVLVARLAFHQTQSDCVANEPGIDDIHFPSPRAAETIARQSQIDSTMDFDITTRVANRHGKRAKQSMAKWRRQSMIGTNVTTGRGRRAGISSFAQHGVLGGRAAREPVGQIDPAVLPFNTLSALNEDYDESMSPEVKTKSSTKKNRRVVSSQHHLDWQESLVASSAGADSSLMAGSPEQHAGVGSSFDRLTAGDSHRHPDVPGLTEHTFRGMVVGGTYQQCFDDCTPVVAPCTGTKKHVTRVQLTTTGALELRLYVPSQSTHVTIDLGQQWYWMRSSPDGFLVFRDAIRLPMSAQRVFYYVQRHPLEWALDVDENAISHTLEADLSRGKVEILGGAITLSDMGNSRLARSQQSVSDDSRRSQYNVSWQDHNDEVRGMGPDALEVNYDRSANPSSPLNASLNRSHSLNTSGGFQADDMLAALGRGTGADDCEMDLSLTGADAGYESAAARINMVLYTASADWNQTSIVSYVLEFLLGDNGLGTPAELFPLGARVRRGRRTTNKEQIAEDYTSYRKVSKAWALGSYRLLARHMSIPANTPLMPYSRWLRFANNYAWGKFLSSGACKKVYCVQNPLGMLEAVSVMNVEDLRARSMEGAVSKELEISLACSSIASLNVCPNLVHVYSLFRSECSVPAMMWANTAAAPPPPALLLDVESQQRAAKQNALGLKKQHLTLGTYQYIRMEFCCGGDLEDFVRKSPNMAPATIRNMLFQMCFALYSCREQLSLRHFDIKLLNFLVTNGAALLPPDFAVLEARRAASPFEAFRDPANNSIDMCVGFGQHVFCLPLKASSQELVKLADFGTSVVGAGGLGDPITVQQFTTLENTPPEFLLLGSMARQAFSADTFPLGLAYFHLLTGVEPYEALLADIYCPPYLIRQLQQVWSPKDVGDQYYVIQEVVNTCRLDDEEALHAEGYDGAILCHTLYRYLVIFGAPEEWEADSLALEVCQHALGLPEVVGACRRMRRSRRVNHKEQEAHLECQRRYKEDQSVWSWKYGNHPLMRRVRERLHSMDKGATRLLERMTHFDPSRRCTMFEALTSSLFTPLLDVRKSSDVRGEGFGHLRGNGSNTNLRVSPRTLPRSPTGNAMVKFMHYYRHIDDGGVEVLPLV